MKSHRKDTLRFVHARSMGLYQSAVHTKTKEKKHSMAIQFEPIGVIRSPFKSIEGMPIQPKGAAGIRGSVEVFPEYEQCLKDLDGFSHVYLLYHFHLVMEWKPLVTPFMDSVKRGLFATRAPKRPNPIGLSVVKLLSIEGGRLEIENVDVVDGAPLLDIKPYVPDFDNHPATRIGWLEEAKGKVLTKKSDSRFR